VAIFCLPWERALFGVDITLGVVATTVLVVKAVRVVGFGVKVANRVAAGRVAPESGALALPLKLVRNSHIEADADVREGLVGVAHSFFFIFGVDEVQASLWPLLLLVASPASTPADGTVSCGMRFDAAVESTGRHSPATGKPIAVDMLTTYHSF
jgi:hypothetical protein